MGFRFGGPAEHVRSFSSVLLDFLFPPLCVQCRKLGRRLCVRCAGTIPWIGPQQCPVCGLPRGAVRRHPCFEPARLTFIRSAAEFSGAARKALHALKYTSDRGLADELIRLCAPRWAMPSWEFDALLPVPLGRARERDRGYNQARLLADALSRTVGIPVAAGSLSRIRETPSQVGLTHGERRRNVAGAFRASSVEGKNVLLVDDVCTTGATLQSCAAALAEAGAGTVGALTVARAPAPDDRRTA